MILGFAVMGASLVGVALAFALDASDRTYRSGEQIRTATGLRTLALMPAIGGSALFKTPPHRFLSKNRSSQFAESVRTLSAGIRFSRQDMTPRVVLVTSSHPKEGKSTVSLCLAQEYAMAGHRTVLIDADLRRPSIHRTLDMSREPGLVEVLHADARLNEVLMFDEASNLYVLPAGNTKGAPPDILGSPRMRKLLAGLPKWFDYIIIDSPPVLAVSDAKLMVRDADSTVFVVKWGKTRRSSVNNCLRQLLDCGGHLSGVVLTMVDGKRHAQYGYTDSDYFSPNVRRYYTS